MRSYHLKDTTVINVDAIQSISPIDTDGFGGYKFCIQMNNHYIEPRFKSSMVTEEEREKLILFLGRTN